jgi:hypothetical protein
MKTFFSFKHIQKISHSIPSILVSACFNEELYDVSVAIFWSPTERCIKILLIEMHITGKEVGKYLEWKRLGTWAHFDKVNIHAIQNDSVLSVECACGINNHPVRDLHVSSSFDKELHNFGVAFIRRTCECCMAIILKSVSHSMWSLSMWWGLRKEGI